MECRNCGYESNHPPWKKKNCPRCGKDSWEGNKDTDL